VFCPNCGTQNPDAAQTCSKCNFHLKSVAAPKFKGTMLMMNQTGAHGATPGAGAAAPPRVSPPPAVSPAPPPVAMPYPPGPSVPNKLKGTMVGVAPMAGPGFGAPAPVAVPSAVAHSPATPGAAFGPGAMEAGSAFTPAPAPLGGHPLVGTLPAEGTFPRGAPPYGGVSSPPIVVPSATPTLGSAPMQPGYSAFGPSNTVAVTGPYAAQPHPGGGQPSVQGASSYGPPAPSPFTPPPYAGAQYGGPSGDFAPKTGALAYGSGPASVSPQSMVGFGPTRRDALMTIVLGLLVGRVAFGLFPLFALAGAAWYLVITIQMVSELKAVTRNEAFAWWPVLVPFYSMYWLWILAPQEVAAAKQRLGVAQPPRSTLLYVLVWHFALASDLNDMVR